MQFCFICHQPNTKPLFAGTTTSWLFLAKALPFSFWYCVHWFEGCGSCWIVSLVKGFLFRLKSWASFHMWLFTRVARLKLRPVMIFFITIISTAIFWRTMTSSIFQWGILIALEFRRLWKEHLNNLWAGNKLLSDFNYWSSISEYLLSWK